MTKLKSIEDRVDLRSKNKIKKGAGQDKKSVCVKKASDFVECKSMREGGRVSKLCSCIKIIFVTKLAKVFFYFFLFLRKKGTRLNNIQ